MGKVVDAKSNAPLPGVRVTLGRWGSFTRQYPIATFTDESGEFRFEGFEPGGFMPEVRSAELYGRAPHKVTLGFAETSEPITIAAHPAFAVRGALVIAGESSSPCTRGHVELTHNKTKDTLSGPADSQGKVEVLAVLPGTYAVAVTCHDAISKETYADIVVDAAPVTNARREVDRGQTLSGFAVDASGDPVAHARITAGPAGAGPRARTTHGAAHSGSGNHGRRSSGTTGGDRRR